MSEAIARAYPRAKGKAEGKLGTHFSIAGLRVSVSPSDAAPVAELAKAWGQFVAEGASECSVDLELTPPVARLPGWIPPMPTVSSLAGGGISVRGDAFSAEISADRRRARVWQPPERFPIEAVVKVLLADRLLGEGGLLLHGVGLMASGRAAVFVGHSGAGKSTLGELGQRGGLTRLSDELVAIRSGKVGYRAEGTPWNIGEPAMGELCWLGLLAHAPEASLEACPEAEVLRMVLPNALMPDPSPEGRSRMFRSAARLIGSVRPVRLRFARDLEGVKLLRRELEDA